MPVFLIIGAGLEAERGRGANKWGLATKPQRPMVGIFLYLFMAAPLEAPLRTQKMTGISENDGVL